MVQNRNYGIDVLRIISMLMVVTLHILGHGGILGALFPTSISYKTIWFLEIMCYCAVNCYVLISGYVNINSKYKYSNIIVLWLQVFFYSVIISLGLFLLNKTDKNTLFQALFPLCSHQYWFFTSYFGLFLFIPIINKAIQIIDEKIMKRIVYLLILFMSILPTLLQNDIFNTKNGYSTMWFIVLYIIGAYIGKYKPYRHKSYVYLTGYGICIFLTWVSKLAIEKYSIINNSHLMISYTSPTILMSGIFLILFFSNYRLNPALKRIVSLFSSTSFGVYLIHEHPLIRAIIIKNRFVGYASLSIDKLLVNVIFIVIFIYIICSFLDYIRLCFFNKLNIKQRIRLIEIKLLKMGKE